MEPRKKLVWEVVSLSNKVHTAAIKQVHSTDVDGAHSSGPTNGNIFVWDGNDGWLPILGEGKPVIQMHKCDERFKLYTCHHGLFSELLRSSSAKPLELIIH